MSDIEKVKKLRNSTGAGFKDCNAALKEANGDINKASEILRVKGIAKASKKMNALSIVTTEKDYVKLKKLDISKIDLKFLPNYISENKEKFFKRILEIYCSNLNAQEETLVL